MKKENNIGFLIHRISNRMRTNFDAQMKKYDLTYSQSQVLFHLKNNGGSMSQRQLQDMMKVSHPTMVGLVQRLEANDFVRTSLDDKDRRNKIVSLSQQAELFSNDVEASRKKNRKKMLKGFDEKEEEELYRLLERVYENINA